MKRPLLVLAGVALLTVGLLFSRSSHSDTGVLATMSQWEPSVSTIKHEIGTERGIWNDQRHERFCDLFKKRFRDHSIAIGLKVLPDTHIKLMCATIIPKWNMARIAIQLHDDLKEVFGEDYVVDIHETYISVNTHKIGELRLNGEKLFVEFDNRWLKESQEIEKAKYAAQLKAFNERIARRAQRRGMGQARPDSSVPGQPENTKRRAVMGPPRS